MTKTQTLSKIWTATVAYLALTLGAGLSITFNVVDVMDVRGAELDRWDIVTAVAFPALVVLMVELFVSRLWIGKHWTLQVIRWAGTAAIGGIAMRVSWVHGHDFFISRGQAADVANMAPLAIDMLAIMATALILAGRKPMDIEAPATDMPPRSRMLDVRDVRTQRVVDTMMAEELDKRAAAGLDIPRAAAVPDTQVDMDLDSVDVADGLDKLEDLANEDNKPVSAPPATRRVKVAKAIVDEHIREAHSQGYRGGKLEDTVSRQLGVHPRTVRRDVARLGLSDNRP